MRDFGIFENFWVLQGHEVCDRVALSNLLEGLTVVGSRDAWLILLVLFVFESLLIFFVFLNISKINGYRVLFGCFSVVGFDDWQFLEVLEGTLLLFGGGCHLVGELLLHV